jgi:hypothetical protein
MSYIILKRELNKIYDHANEKRLHNYVNDFTFRLNEDVKYNTLSRLESSVNAWFGQQFMHTDSTV